MKNKIPLILLVLFSGGWVYGAQLNTDGRLQISADDFSFSARLIGSFQADADIYDTSNNNPGFELKDGAFIRRARIGLQGNVRDWEYKIEFDMASNQSELKSGYLRRLLGPGKIWVGQFKVFEGLEQLNSENDILFMEKGYISDIVPGYRIGVGYNGTLGYCGFGGTIYDRRESSDGPSGPTAEDPSSPIPGGYGASTRIYIAPIHEPQEAFHLGASYARENSDSNGARVRVRPLGQADLYENGEDFRFTVFDREDQESRVHRFNVEGVAINGPFLLQGEYLNGTAKSDLLPNDDFNAMYVEASWIVTGESREYDFLIGEVKRPIPNREIGALELAYRIQRAERSHVPQAKLSAMEYGVTYYANANIRFLVNYGIAQDDFLNEKTKLLSFRSQFDF